MVLPRFIFEYYVFDNQNNYKKMKLTNWRSFSPQSTYQRATDNFFNDRYRMLLGMDRDFSPAVNTSENKKSYEIEVAVPGFKKNDFNITVNNGLLTISCDRSSNNEKSSDGYTNREFSYSSFSRSFTLPTDVDDEHINARYEDGILYVTLPREVVAEENEAIRTVPIR